MKHLLCGTAFLELLAGTARAWVVPANFWAEADIGTAWLNILILLGRKVPEHTHDTCRRGNDQLISMLRCDGFLEWLHLRIRIVLVSQCPDGNH